MEGDGEERDMKVTRHPKICRPQRHSRGRTQRTDILVVDTGESIVGIYTVGNHRYTPYQGTDIARAIERIRRASVVVTYNGNNRDMLDLARFAGLPPGKELPLSGEHIDMREVCWSSRIWGKSLRDTYRLHFPQLPKCDDSYVRANWLDTYMTFRLWQLWRNGRLKVLDGHFYSHGYVDVVRRSPHKGIQLLDGTSTRRVPPVAH